MRFLHTSDWHLGQSFMNKSRQTEHEMFLKWLLEQVSTLDVDALVIAGDIFDTGTPPSYARKLYYDFLRDISKTGVTVVIVGGNHDSVSTLNESGRLLEALNVNVVAGVSASIEEQIYLISRADEPVGVICAIPFLRDRDVRTSIEGEDADSKSEALRSGIKEFYSKAQISANELCKKTGVQLPVVATGHLTTTGGEITEGVRDIYIGTLQSYSDEDFPDGFDYIALGHLHKKQSFGKREHVYYCGSPIPLSFMEARYDKYVLQVEVEVGEKPQVQELTVPRFQELLSIKGTLEEIENTINGLVFSSDDTIWLEIELNSEAVVTGLQARLAEVIKELPLEILRIKRIRSNKSSSINRQQQETLETLSVEDVFERRLALEELDEETKKKVRDTFQTIREEVRVETGN